MKCQQPRDTCSYNFPSLWSSTGVTTVWYLWPFKCHSRAAHIHRWSGSLHAYTTCADGEKGRLIDLHRKQSSDKFQSSRPTLNTNIAAWYIHMSFGKYKTVNKIELSSAKPSRPLPPYGAVMRSGGRHNIKMLIPSREIPMLKILCNGNLHNWKDGLYFEIGSGSNDALYQWSVSKIHIINQCIFSSMPFQS